ncbi:MAG: hypothetical protein Q8M03_03180 [Legionella sp.]|nr:hypothetical protein [Legionella sp.]
MPISDDCLDLLKTLCIEYSQNAPTDRNFQELLTLLTNLYNSASTHPEKYKDDRITTILTSSALILKENPFFNTCCRKFICAFQSQTGALDSFVDRNLTLKDASAFFEQEENTTAVSSEAATPFLRDLQTALAKLHKDKDIRETLEKGHSSFQHYLP